MSKVSSALRCTPPIPPVAKTLDTGTGRRDHGCGNRGGAGAALGDREGEIGARQLHRAFRLCQRFQLGVVQADMQDAVDDGDGCRHGTLFANDALRRCGPYSRLPGKGMPWVMMVDSKATIAAPRALGGCDFAGIFHRQQGGNGLGHREILVGVLRRVHDRISAGGTSRKSRLPASPATFLPTRQAASGP